MKERPFQWYLMFANPTKKWGDSDQQKFIGCWRPFFHWSVLKGVRITSGSLCAYSSTSRTLFAGKDHALPPPSPPKKRVFAMNSGNFFVLWMCANVPHGMKPGKFAILNKMPYNLICWIQGDGRSKKSDVFFFFSWIEPAQHRYRLANHMNNLKMELTTWGADIEVPVKVKGHEQFTINWWEKDSLWQLWKWHVETSTSSFGLLLRYVHSFWHVWPPAPTQREFS